jgi:hypothetical protein
MNTVKLHTFPTIKKHTTTVNNYKIVRYNKNRLTPVSQQNRTYFVGHRKKLPFF